MMLTARENELYNYIVQFKKINGYAPTVREMCTGINTNSIHHVTVMLEHLCDEGYIKMKPKKPRALTVVKFIS